MIEQTVTELTPLVGTRPACRAPGASHATIYRRRSPPPARPARTRPVPARALSLAEREAVLEVLHSARFVDSSPAQVWATFIDEGCYLASQRTMYRLLAATHGAVRERRDQLTHPAYAKPELLAPAAQCGVVVGHHQTQRAREVEVLLPVRDPRCVQPLRRRVDRPAPLIGGPREGADHPRLRSARRSPATS